MLRSGNKLLHNIVIGSFILAECVRIVRRFQFVILRPEWQPFLRGLENASLAVACAVIAINLISGMYSGKALGCIAAVSAMVVLVAHYSTDLNPLRYWVFIVAAADIPLEDILKKSAIVHILLIFSVVALAETGLLITCNIDNSTRGVREYLGYNYANTVPNYFFYIALMLIYWKKESISWKAILVIALTALYLYIRTKSRNPFILTLAVVFAAALLKNFRTLRSYKKIYGIASILIAVFLPVFFAYASIFYDGNVTWMNRLNNFITGRLAFGYRAYADYGLTLFGQPIVWVGVGYPTTDWAKYNYVDNSFLQILFNHGIIFTLVVLIALVAVCVSAIKKKDTYLLMTVSVIIVHSSIDSLLIDMDFNPFFMTLSFFGWCKAREKLPDIIYGSHMFQTLRKHQFLLEELIKRDFKKKYKGTILGMAWSVLNPLLMLLIMRTVFTHFFGSSIPHYTTYLFCGNIVFSFFNESTSQGMQALLNNADIFTKVNVPKYLFVLSRSVQTLINFGITLVVFFILCAFDGITFTWKFIFLLYPILLLVLFNTGVSMTLSAMFVFFRDLQYLWGVFTQLLTYLSAIFYSIDSFPLAVRNAFLLNPVYLFIRYFRKIVIDGCIPSLGFHAFMAAYTLLFLLIGIRMYKKYDTEFLYYV